MDQIKCFTNYLKDVFGIKSWWYFLPFSLIGLVFVAVFYILSPIFMLIDLIRFELKKILYNSNETISGSAQFVKFLVGFLYYIIFAIVSAIMLLPLAIVYFLTVCSFFVSSFGSVKGNPFAFHSIETSL